MHPPLTYELRVTFGGEAVAATRGKKTLIDWLLLSGVDSFVEGELAVDINQNQDEPPRDYYTELGGDLTPVSIYRYGLEGLEDLRAKLAHRFGPAISLEIHTLPTATWMDGWKESFKPFTTAAFYVRPPWEAPMPPSLAVGRRDLVIEPGMAFGTGQHATTRLCLEELGRDAREHHENLSRRTVLDVGTGTGILAIGASLLGYGPCIGTDIEDDAMLAAAENARLNHVHIDWQRGSIPASRTYDLVLANILAVVIIRLMDELAAALVPGGRLLLSGILAEEEQEVAERGAAAGLTRVRSAQHEGWACLVMAKPLRATP